MFALLWLSMAVFPPDTLSNPRFGFSYFESNAALCKLVYSKYIGSELPVYRAYAAAAHMSMANHVWNPYSKWNYFNEGKTQLEKLIQSYPALIELRYIRYTLQRYAPTMLGYTTHQKSDREILLKSIPMLQKSDPFLFQRCKSVLNL
ncbi:MAG: hypothetical protein ACO27Q_01140 [Bacteroidia bacterium]